MTILPQDFYQGRATALIARELLGKILVHESLEGLTSGIIVETEAYLAADDPASHSYHGLTIRNQPMWGPPGSSYIYMSYGIHYCFNVVCQPQGMPEAVLIRGVQPLEGIPLMRARRGGVPGQHLADGPGKLCQAMGIDLRLNGHPLQQAPLYILDGTCPGKVLVTPRIGISVGTDLPLRFVARS